MADNRKYIQGQKYQLAGSGISSSDTSLTLESFKFPGTTTTIVTADIGSLAWCTLEPGTEREEIITFTTITQNSDGTATLSGITRGISFNAPYTASAALQKSHGGGTTLIITNNPGFYDEFANKNNDETVAGYWEVADPITAQGIVPRDYMLGLINGGAVSTNALIETGTAGETVAAGNLVYLKASDSRWWKADADLTATIDLIQLGIAQGAGTAGASITGGVLRRGVDSNQSGMSVGLAYISNTAGALATTAGTIERVVGNFLSATTIDFDPNFYYLPTKDIKDASVGSQGIPKSTNKYVTQDNLSSTTTDQTQTTQDATVEFGMSTGATNKNKTAQSFIPTKTKTRGVTLYKSADSGTFTGTVTITLQVDSSGSPSGVALATRTFTNAEWVGLPVGEFTATYSTEYAAQVVGSLYWIVATTSTSDNTNHPNLGTNSAGGYGSGSAKYYDTAWVAISTIDLYFKTLEGNVSQVVVTDTGGKIPSNFYDIDNMPIPAFQQAIPILSAASGGIIRGSTCNQSGSVVVLYTSQSSELVRLARDAKTGSYFVTHEVSSAIGGIVGAPFGLIVIGDYVYVFFDNGANMGCYRYDLATLANETVIAVPATATSGTSNISAWTDGKYAYVMASDAATTVNIWSISGTTFSAVSTATATTANLNSGQSTSFYDGVTAYVSYQVATGTFFKLTAIDGTAATQTTYIWNQFSDTDTASANHLVLINIDSERMYIGRLTSIYDETNVTSWHLMLVPITKP